MWESRTILATAEGGRLAGSIHLVTPEPHPRWMPSAGFMFDAEGTRPAGLLVSLDPGDREHVLVILRMPDTMESMPIARFPVDRWVPISASIDERDIFRITVGRQHAQHRVPAGIARRPLLMCSSGIFDFALVPGMQVSDERYREN
jgi:hypothetical protein